ncbi:hypothetical protein LUX39_14835 [Actinomadura madurae]|nr:hypothetical protein [Actinomadura madurae]MCP9978669.1 hypothetical protein [Actinomadura madurae]MCQ0014867.1 hypothetical protein [Actinomadura madurae]
MALTPDYDSDPERFRLAARVTRKYLIGARSLHDHIASKLLHSGASRVLDIGCGEGALAGALPTRRRSGSWGWTRPASCCGPTRPRASRRTRCACRSGTARSTPPWPSTCSTTWTIRAARSARPAASSPRAGCCWSPRSAAPTAPNWPPVWRPEPTTFDAEDAPARVCEVFGEVEVERWDAPLLTLPDPASVRDYLIARHVPRPQAAEAATQLNTPLPVTKRGSLVLARR